MGSTGSIPLASPNESITKYIISFQNFQIYYIMSRDSFSFSLLLMTRDLGFCKNRGDVA